MVETARDFNGHWYGTGTIAGAGDAEVIQLDTGEYEISEVVDTDLTTVTLKQNFYDPTGDDVYLLYRHGATEVACLSASWINYSAPFSSLGFVQIRVSREYWAKVLSYSPVGYWPLDEGGGLTARCLVNSAQNGAYKGGISVGSGTSEAGKSCPWFDGSDDVVDILTGTLATAFPTDTGSLVMWAKVNASGVWTDSTTRNLFYDADPGYNRYFYVRRTATNNQLLSQDYSNPSNAVHSWLTTGGETAWFHVAVTWNSTSGNLNSYINGSLEAGPTTTVASWGANNPSNIICIGASGPAGPEPWSGWISDVAILDYELTAGQVSDLASVG